MDILSTRSHAAPQSFSSLIANQQGKSQGQSHALSQDTALNGIAPRAHSFSAQMEPSAQYAPRDAQDSSQVSQSSQAPQSFSSLTQGNRTAGKMPEWQPSLEAKHALGLTQSQQSIDSIDDYIGDTKTIEKQSFGEKYTRETDPRYAEVGFGDFVDMVNPLHHIPLVGNIYRHVTGDEIKPPARILGGGIFGGPIGMASAMANAVVEDQTGADIGGNMIAAINEQATGAPAALGNNRGSLMAQGFAPSHPDTSYSGQVKADQSNLNTAKHIVEHGVENGAEHAVKHGAQHSFANADNLDIEWSTPSLAQAPSILSQSTLPQPKYAHASTFDFVETKRELGTESGSAFASADTTDTGNSSDFAQSSLKAGGIDFVANQHAFNQPAPAAASHQSQESANINALKAFLQDGGKGSQNNAIDAYIAAGNNASNRPLSSNNAPSPHARGFVPFGNINPSAGDVQSLFGSSRTNGTMPSIDPKTASIGQTSALADKLAIDRLAPMQPVTSVSFDE